MILTIKQITELAKYAGVEINETIPPGIDDLETEICIELDKSGSPYAYLYEYPDEGIYPLS